MQFLINYYLLFQTYFLNFENTLTVQQVLSAYKKWFLKETKMPSFMQEPPACNSTNTNSLQHPSTPLGSVSLASGSMELDSSSLSESTTDSTDHSNNNNHGGGSTNTSLFTKDSTPPDQQLTRIGYMRCLQIFFYHSSNLLLNRNNFQRDKIKSICCYTLEIYKLFIRKIKMDSQTWTLLITILLKASEFIFTSEYLVNNRHEPATSQLIKLMTETALLAIVKASFSFTVSNDLWDQLMTLLSSVSSNSDVIDKWIEVIDDLIRQVFKTSYQIDINQTIESKLDKKGKLKKKMLYPQNGTGTTTVSSTGASNSSTSSSSVHAPLTVSAASISQSMVHHGSKPRSRTEIYSPSSLPHVQQVASQSQVRV